MRGAGIELVLLFLGWSGFASLVLVLVNSALLLRARPTLGLAYFELRYQNASPKRLWLTSAATWTLPILLGVVAASLASAVADDSPNLPAVVLALVTLGSWTWNWLCCLGSSRRTLVERLAGHRVARLGSTFEPEVTPPARSLWPDVWLLAPVAAALVFPLYRAVLGEPSLKALLLQGAALAFYVANWWLRWTPGKRSRHPSVWTEFSFLGPWLQLLPVMAIGSWGVVGGLLGIVAVMTPSWLSRRRGLR